MFSLSVWNKSEAVLVRHPKVECRQSLPAQAAQHHGGWRRDAEAGDGGASVTDSDASCWQGWLEVGIKSELYDSTFPTFGDLIKNIYNEYLLGGLGLNIIFGNLFVVVEADLFFKFYTSFIFWIIFWSKLLYNKVRRPQNNWKALWLFFFVKFGVLFKR